MIAPRQGRATIAIAALTIGCSIAAFAVGFQSIALQAGFIPARAAGITGFAVPFLLTPLTATLVHGGIGHLFFNILLLIFCGRAVELALGAKFTTLLYVIGAYGAALADYWVGRASLVPMVGASGAISAWVAVYAMLYARNAIRAIGPIPGHWVRAIWLLAGWIFIQVLTAYAFAASPYAVATAAHVGGFATGLALTRPLLAWRFRSA